MNLFLISKFLSFTLHFSKFVMLSKGNDPFREEHLAYGTNSNNFNLAAIDGQCGQYHAAACIFVRNIF